MKMNKFEQSMLLIIINDFPPALSSIVLACISHYNLALQLEKNSFGKLSTEWYNRAYQIALKNQEYLPPSIISKMYESLLISRQLNSPPRIKTLQSNQIHNQESNTSNLESS